MRDIDVAVAAGFLPTIVDGLRITADAALVAYGSRMLSAIPSRDL